MLSIKDAKEFIKQEAERIINYGYHDKYYLKNGIFKKGINSPNQYCDKRILKSDLLDDFRSEMQNYIKEVNEETEKIYKNNDLSIDEIVEMEEKSDNKIKNHKDEIKIKVFNKIDNLSNQEIIDLGIRLDSSSDDVDDNICPKCGGTGYIPQYSNVDNGRCWECGGTGMKEENNEKDNVQV